MLASKIVWLDAFITNIDRTFRNTNMLMWNKELWLIDHGAAFYFHHTWDNWEQNAKSPFVYVKDHVLLPQASHLEDVHQLFTNQLSEQILKDIVDQLPDEWLRWEDTHMTSSEIRSIYLQFLVTRLATAEHFLKQAQDARKILV